MPRKVGKSGQRGRRLTTEVLCQGSLRWRAALHSGWSFWCKAVFIWQLEAPVDISTISNEATGLLRAVLHTVRSRRSPLAWQRSKVASHVLGLVAWSRQRRRTLHGRASSVLDIIDRRLKCLWQLLCLQWTTTSSPAWQRVAMAQARAMVCWHDGFVIRVMLT